MIKDLLQNKTSYESANIKATEIVKNNFVGEHTFGAIRMEIQSVSKIDGGIELFSRAWKNEKQLGFGADGTVDIERFRIFNPPILVDDPNGDIVYEGVDKRMGAWKITLREDFVVAVLNSLSHTISIVGKTNTQIIRGSIGTTTDTFYPTDNSDGNIERDGAQTWAAIRGGNGTAYYTGPSANYVALLNGTATQWNDMIRSVFPFDTSSISDTDTISSATFSITGTGSHPDAFSQTVVCVNSTQASNTAVAVSDYQLNVGASLISDTTITPTNWNVTGFNDFALNAAGLTVVSKTGFTHVGLQLSGDRSNTEPTVSATVAGVIGKFSSVVAGVDSDPKLVVVHVAAASGPANLKSLDTNIKNNIKSYNTNVLANIKSINSNT